MASLAVVTLVAMLGAGLVQVQTAITRRQALGIDNTRALYVAEAGLSEAYLALAQGKSGNVGTSEVPAFFDNGVYWVEATVNLDGTVTLESTGLCGQGRFSIEVVVDPHVNPVGDLGIFADEHLEVGEGSVIDSFDSSLGDLASQLDPTTGEGSSAGRVRSNGDVDLRGWTGSLASTDPTKVLGEVRPGPDGVLSIDPGVTVSGSTSPVPHLIPMPEVELPVIALEPEVVTLTRDSTIVMGPGELAQTSLTVQTGKTLVLKGPLVAVMRDLIVPPGAELRFDSTDGEVLVYVARLVDFQEGSAISTVGDDPTKVTVMVPRLNEDPLLPLPIQLRATGTFLGTFYAPENTVRIPAGLHLAGTVAARDLILEPDARVSFDRALLSAGSGRNPAPRLIAWSPMPPPAVPIVRSSKDPLTFLADAAITPLSSSRGPTETKLEITYVDNTMTKRTWIGDGILMNWADVHYVIELRWYDPATDTPLEPVLPPGSLEIGL